MDVNELHPAPPRWLHAWAVFTVIAAVPVLILGAFVTTLGVGMADQRPVVNPIQAVGEMAEGTQSLGFLVEHSHRLPAWGVGLAGIILAASSWLADPRRWAKWLATVALTLIIVQGLLGIFRVRLNAWWGPELAWIHGCFAQIVFAVLVSVALMNARRWTLADYVPSGSKLRHWSVGCVALVFGQLILGGMVRHQNHLLMARLHLIVAFVVLAGLLWLVKLALEERNDFRRPAFLLIAVLSLQILLGVEAWVSWMQRLLDPAAGIREPAATLWIRSGHYFLGTLVFATTVVIALKAHRGLVLTVAAGSGALGAGLPTPPPTSVTARRLEGAA